MSSPLSNLLSVIGPLIANQALATLALFLFLQSARLVTSQNLQMFCLSVPVYSRGKLLLMFYFTSSLKFHIFFVHLVHYWSPINKLPLFFLTQRVLAKQKLVEVTQRDIIIILNQEKLKNVKDILKTECIQKLFICKTVKNSQKKSYHQKWFLNELRTKQSQVITPERIKNKNPWNLFSLLFCFINGKMTRRLNQNFNSK